jgi:hypothetical protein
MFWLRLYPILLASPPSEEQRDERVLWSTSYLRSSAASPLGSRTREKPAELEEAGVLDHFSAKKAGWLFVRPFADLSKSGQEELLALCQASAQAAAMYQLAQEFFRRGRMPVRERNSTLG